ncbi:MAG: hypothetical protein AAGC55_34720, partial [Myxococcota bacterium]
MTLPILISGKSDAAVAAQAKRLGAHLAGNPDLALADLTYSLATTRSHFEHRAVILSRDIDAARAELDALAGGKAAPEVRRGQVRTGGELAFLFTGQGSQRPGMGRELHRLFPVYRD